MISACSKAIASPLRCRVGLLSLRSLCVGAAGCRCVDCRTLHVWGAIFGGVRLCRAMESPQALPAHPGRWHSQCTAWRLTVEACRGPALQWERQAGGVTVPPGPEWGGSEAELRPVREGRCRHCRQWVLSVRGAARSSWCNRFVHVALDNHQSDFLDVSATLPASPEHRQPTAMSLQERLSLQACPVRRQLKGGSRHLLAQGALRNLVGLFVISPGR